MGIESLSFNNSYYFLSRNFWSYQIYNLLDASLYVPFIFMIQYFLISEPYIDFCLHHSINKAPLLMTSLKISTPEWWITLSSWGICLRAVESLSWTKRSWCCSKLIWRFFTIEKLKLMRKLCWGIWEMFNMSLWLSTWRLRYCNSPLF